MDIRLSEEEVLAWKSQCIQYERNLYDQFSKIKGTVCMGKLHGIDLVLVDSKGEVLTWKSHCMQYERICTEEHHIFGSWIRFRFVAVIFQFSYKSSERTSK